MDGTVEVIVDPFTSERISLRLPLTYRTEPAQARRALGLAEHVDVSDPVMARAVGLLHALTLDAPTQPIAFLGGVAFRCRSASSNSTTSGLRRPLHDIDIACHDTDSKKVHAALLALGPSQGSALSVVETHSDRMFNALMGGRRLRLHSIDQVVDGHGVLGTIDLLADEFRFCHRIDLTGDISQASTHRHTLSLATLLLSKLQFIQSIPADHRGKVPGRVLGDFGRHELLIGPEEKDVRDVLALLADAALGEGPEQISPTRFVEPLRTDWGFWTTVRLNLGHLILSPLFVALPAAIQTTVRRKVEALQSATDQVQPKRRLGFLRKQWWEPVESLGVGSAPSATPP